ncbi:MAG: DUF1465 family protein [Rhodospirillales bacterium]|nr:DUF1465 family protein [Rhodospirillales bacterium]
MSQRGDDTLISTSPIDSAELLALYDEAKDMLTEAADYFSGPGNPKNLELTGENSLAYAEGSKSITARLMEIMAWLFVQRAVLAGEMRPEEALKSDNRLGAVTASSVDTSDQRYNLPERFQDLGQRCNDLFDRVYKIDQLLNAPPTSAVH